MTKKKNTDLIESERDKVDNYIITACITLIAAFAVIMSIKKPTEDYLSYAYLISLFSLTISLLASLWHKYRFPKRQQLYRKAVDKILRDISGEIADFGENILIPLKQQKLIESQKKDKKADFRELAKKVDEENNEPAKKVIITYLEKLNYKSKEKSDEIFNKPIKEKNGLLKFRLDKLTNSLRYPTFAIGIIFFFISIFMGLLME